MSKNIANHLVVFLTSFSLLFYQIILTRVFTITKWYNLVSIIITLALIGFGISGTLIAILKKQIEKYYYKIKTVFLALYSFSLLFGFIIYQKIPFNPYELGISSFQIIYLLIYCIAIGIPFLMGAFIIGLSLQKHQTSSIYGINMIGSGLGSFFAILSLYWFHPFTLIVLISIASTLSILIQPFKLKTSKTYAIPLFLITYITLLLLTHYSISPYDISQYKPLSKTLLLPNSHIEFTSLSPLSVVQVISADGLRSTAGLSLNSPYEVPEQKMIFYDGSGTSAITPFEGNLNTVHYLDYTPGALPYKLIDTLLRENLLLIGVGGGEGILKGNLYAYEAIAGVEIDNSVINLMKNDYSNFSGRLYSQSNVKIFNEEARGFINHSKMKYDLIDISLIDAYNNASSGIYAMNESYLYTTESIEQFYNHLSENGILAINRWLNIPPKNGIKMINTIIESLKNLGVTDISKHIIFIRSIQTGTFIISKAPFSQAQLQLSKDFCNSRLFDIIYQSEIKSSELNKFIKLDNPTYFTATKNFLTSNYNQFNDLYPFDISPPSDNKPYFYNFFNYNMLKQIISRNKKSPPVIEWGYFLLVILILPTTLTALIFIIIPLHFIKEKTKIEFKESLFFALLGIGFFFIEMPLIQKLILFLSHPIYSVATVITTLLIFSGIGSFFSNSLFPEKKRILYVTILIAFYLLLFTLFYNKILLPFSYLPFLKKLPIAILVISPIAFLMGIPFPFSLNKFKRIKQKHYPWIWGINGFSSVISIIIATILAIEFGFNIVFMFAIVCYLLAGFISLSLFNCFKE